MEQKINTIIIFEKQIYDVKSFSELVIPAYILISQK